MYYVYILQSVQNNERYYRGRTKNLKNRLDSHNQGKSPHTNKYKPWKLIFYSAFKKEQKAIDFEKYLKTASGIAFARKRLIS